MSVSIRFDAKQLKSDVATILNRKVDAITTNKNLYTELLELYYTYIVGLMPRDTGALQGNGEGKPLHGGYDRFPKITISPGHGIETNPYEARPDGKVYYGRMALERVFGDDIAQEMQSILMQSGKWAEFCKEAAPLIAEAMNNG